MTPIVCITGATSGIGEATARKFASEHYNVIITGRRKERLDLLKTTLEKEHRISVLSVCFDVRNREEVVRHLGNLPSEWENIDILVNNAGLAAGKEPIQEGDNDDWERMIDTNIKGLLYVTKTLLPKMCERKKGHIINLCSTAGKEVYPGGNVYCATKHAVDAISKGIRMDALPYHVKVTNICPGAVETEFSLVRFHGDQSKADATYVGYQPLTGKDIADIIYYCATLPAHVNINDLVVTPTAQAGATLFCKDK